MVTELLDGIGRTEQAVHRAGELLRAGELVAIPTETVYGLAARVSDEGALRHVFEVKGRPADNPLIVHVAHRTDVHTLAVVDDISARLIDAFWPGALTIVMKKKPGVLDAVTAGLDTVALRMPALALTRAIIDAAGEPLAAPSANTSGRPSATTAQHVLSDFDGRIAAIVDAGPCEQGIESTVVHIHNGTIHVLRPGLITRTQLEAAAHVPVSTLNANSTASAASPGTRHRHYAPHAPMRLCNSVDEALRHIQTRAMQELREGTQTLVLAPSSPENDRFATDTANVVVRDLQTATLYAELRRADDLRMNEILVVCTDAVKLDEALMNRLRKAAEPFGESGVDQ